MCSRRCSTDELGCLHADWTNYVSRPRQKQGRGVWPRKIDLSPPPPSPPPTHTPVKYFSLTVPRRFFCLGLFLLWFVFECVCRLHLFVLDSHLATLWESNCPFGFLLVMFPLGSSYFVFVFLSLWCLWLEVWDNCIDSDHCLPFYFPIQKLRDDKVKRPNNFAVDTFQDDISVAVPFYLNSVFFYVLFFNPCHAE